MHPLGRVTVALAHVALQEALTAMQDLARGVRKRQAAADELEAVSCLQPVLLV